MTPTTHTTPPDDRLLTWPQIENEIQSRAEKKDSVFRLEGHWKTFIRLEKGFKIFSVDGTWVRNNISVMFGHGGHGLVHEFIPMDEVWISTHHQDDGPEPCICKLSYQGQPMSQACIESTILHEITEHQEMKAGKNYWEAHNIALDAERAAGLLPDPYDDRS